VASLEGSQRSLRASSARSLLLTILGEFVLPKGGSVLTWPLVTALGLLGVEEKAARQALSRTAGDGLIVSERDGRRVRFSLTEKGHQLLEEGTDRIYGFLRDVSDWDGRWLVLMISVPESQRDVRHQLRTRLAWAGLGSPLPGVWVTPHVEKEKEVEAVVSDLGVDGFSWIGPTAAIGDVRTLVDQAWALDDVAARYVAFLDEFSSTNATLPQTVFVNQVRLVHMWRRFPFVDPALPPFLLPEHWPSSRAVSVFHRQHDGRGAPRNTGAVCADKLSDAYDLRALKLFHLQTADGPLA
jgi:phenylacetic acid degradation operon negative regulatory protein